MKNKNNIISEKPLFADAPELLTPEAVAKLLSCSVTTIYDWRYRSRSRKMPQGMFLKIGRRLYVRTSILRQWIDEQNVGFLAE